MTDGELLQHYAARGDGGAFAEIVRRHGGMVHATAKRLARDDADDVTQAVFLLLSRKAGELRRYRSLAGWLYNVTRYCASNARRTHGRRQRHLERYQREAAMTHGAPSPAENDPAVAELLDAGLAKLKDDQRQAVLLRYIEGLSLDEAAERIGINAAAVAKRAERGLARLREYFAARGVTLSDAALAATPVTPALLASLSQVGAGGAAAADGAAATLASSTAKSMAAVASVKAAAVVLAAAAAVTAVAVAAGSSFRTPRHARAASPATATAAAAPVPVPVPPTPAPTTRPPLTAEGGKAVAEALLRAIRERDEDRIAALCAAPTERERRDFAAGVIAEVLDRAYARFPQRLDRVVNTMMTSDMGGQAISMELEAQPPTLAQVRRLRIELRPVGGTWRVSTARMSQVGVVQGEQFPKPPASQPTTATTAPSDAYAKAAELVAKPRVTLADLYAGVTEAERPTVLPMLRGMEEDLRQVAELLRPTEFAAFEADARTYSDRLGQLRVAMEKGGVAAFYARGKELLNDAALDAAVGRLSEVQQKLKERLAAAPATSRPAQPNVPPGTCANAAEIFQAFQARVMFDPEKLTDADAPRIAESLKLAQADVRRLADVLRPTDLALDDATVRHAIAYLEAAGERLARQGVRALKSHDEGAQRDPAMAAAGERLFNLGRTLTARADAEADAAQPTGPRPSAFAPPVQVTQAWDGKAVRLPGPVTVPPWFRASRTFQVWQKRHNVETFRTRDDGGNLYEIHCSGGVREQDGKTYDVIPSVRMYRPDGTLAATSEWDHYGQATSWAMLDETGERYTMQVTTQTRGGDHRAPREIMTVSFFDAEENQREWNMKAGNFVWLETLNNPIGTTIRVLNQAPRETKTTTTKSTTPTATRGR